MSGALRVCGSLADDKFPKYEFIPYVVDLHSKPNRNVAPTCKPVVCVDESLCDGVDYDISGTRRGTATRCYST